MYGWIWRHLPGPVGVRLAISLVLVAGIVALLFFVIFPLIDPLLPFTETVTDN